MLSDFGLLRKSCSRRLTLTPMKVVIGYMPDYANQGFRCAARMSVAAAWWAVHAGQDAVALCPRLLGFL